MGWEALFLVERAHFLTDSSESFCIANSINALTSELSWSLFVRREMGVKIFSEKRINWVKVFELFLEMLLDLLSQNSFRFSRKLFHKLLVNHEISQTFLVILIPFFISCASFVFNSLLTAKNLFNMGFQHLGFFFLVEFIHVKACLLFWRHGPSLYIEGLWLLAGERKNIGDVVCVGVRSLLLVWDYLRMAWVRDLRGVRFRLGFIWSETMVFSRIGVCNCLFRLETEWDSFWLFAFLSAQFLWSWIH
jgi:hypothetical protein